MEDVGECGKAKSSCQHTFLLELLRIYCSSRKFITGSRFLSIPL